MEIKPVEILYGTFINDFCKVGETTLVVSLMREMQGQKCAPLIVKYSTIIGRLLRENKSDEAENLYKKMIKNKIKIIWISHWLMYYQISIVTPTIGIECPHYFKWLSLTSIKKKRRCDL